MTTVDVNRAARGLAAQLVSEGRDPLREARDMLLAAEYLHALACALETPSRETVAELDHWVQELAEVGAAPIRLIGGHDGPDWLRATAARFAKSAHALAAAAGDLGSGP